MRAIVVDRWMETRDLGVREVPEPELGPGTLAVEVRAAGCNFFDILMVRGQYQVKPAFPFIPGAELAGVVRAVGSGVEGFAAGDRILASVPLGAFAERAAVPRRGRHLRSGRGRRVRRLAQVHRLERTAPGDRLRERPHPGGEAEPRAAEEHLPGRPPLGRARPPPAGAHRGDARRAARALPRGQGRAGGVPDLSARGAARGARGPRLAAELRQGGDRKSTRLNSSHVRISYAVFCLEKKKWYTP